MTSDIPRLSTGEVSNLDTYRKLCGIIFGNDSPATKFIDKKIADAANGAAELVLADENQMINLLLNVHNGAKHG